MLDITRKCNIEQIQFLSKLRDNIEQFEKFLRYENDLISDKLDKLRNISKDRSFLYKNIQNLSKRNTYNDIISTLEKFNDLFHDEKSVFPLNFISKYFERSIEAEKNIQNSIYNIKEINDSLIKLLQNNKNTL